MGIFFTADTHFGQIRTLQLSKRPFSRVEEMDSVIINRWNDVVGQNDIVYHLGDFGNPERIKRLAGKIFLLPGNYDTGSVLTELSPYCTQIMPNFQIEKYKLQLIHEPEEYECLQPDYFFLFGHIHKLQMVKKNGLNVGTDCHHFTPVSINDVKFYRNAIENHYDKNVFMPLAAC